MISRFAIRLAAFVLLAATATAQDLSVSLTGSLATGGSIDFAISGAPADAPTAILASVNDDGLSIGNLLTLDIGPPFIVVAVGTSDANGDFGHTISFPAIPAGVTIPPLFLQGLSVAGGFPMPSFATTDVETLTL